MLDSIVFEFVWFSGCVFLSKVQLCPKPANLVTYIVAIKMTAFTLDFVLLLKLASCVHLGYGMGIVANWFNPVNILCVNDEIDHGC